MPARTNNTLTPDHTPNLIFEAKNSDPNYPTFYWEGGSGELGKEGLVGWGRRVW